MFEIARTRSCGEKVQRSTEKEMCGQHTGRHAAIPTDLDMAQYRILHKEMVKNGENSEYKKPSISS